MAKSSGRRLLDGTRAAPFILAGILLALTLTDSPGSTTIVSPPTLGSSLVPRLTQPKPDLTTAHLLADYDRRIAEFKPTLYKNEVDRQAAAAKMETSIDGASVTLTAFIYHVDAEPFHLSGPNGYVVLGITGPVELPPNWRWGNLVKIPATKEDAAKISAGDILTIRGTVRVPGRKEDEKSVRYFEMAHSRIPWNSFPWYSSRMLRIAEFDYTITPAAQAAQTKSHAETAIFLADYPRRRDAIWGAGPHTAEDGYAAEKAVLENVPLTLTCTITSVYAVAPTKEEPAGSIGLSLTNAAEAPGGWYGDPRVRIPGGAAQMAKIHVGDTLVIRGAGHMVNRESNRPDPLRRYGLARVVQGDRALEFANADYTVAPAAPATKEPPPSAAPKASPPAAVPAKQP